MKTPYDKTSREQPSLDRMRADRLAIEEYLRKQAPGAMLDYLSIMRETKVTMNARGKRLLRSALAHLGIVASTVRGSGVRLSCPATALEITDGDIDKIGGQVTRALSRHSLMREAHIGDMTGRAKAAFLLRGAGLAAVHVSISARETAPRALPPVAPVIDMATAAEARAT